MQFASFFCYNLMFESIAQTPQRIEAPPRVERNRWNDYSCHVFAQRCGYSPPRGAIDKRYVHAEFCVHHLDEFISDDAGSLR